MIRWLLPAALLPLAGMGCSEPVSLKQFGDISVSDPEVSGSFVHVDVVNNSDNALCYFEDGLFYGPDSIEGGTGETEVLQPGGGVSSLEDIKLSRTNRREFKLVELAPGRGEVKIKISGQEPPQVGDDLSFDLIYCEPESDGLHRSLVYSSRLK